MKKTIIVVLLFAALCALPLSAQSDNRAGVIVSHFSPREFATGAIPRADLELIVRAGVRAPSAANRQPWHFTVVQNLDLAKRAVPQVVEGNVLIIVSTDGDSSTNTRDILDCALATQSIYLAAQAIGLNSRIYTGPIEAFNRDLKTAFGLPSGHSAVALVRIGRYAPGADATTGASPRNAASSMVTYR